MIRNVSGRLLSFVYQLNILAEKPDGMQPQKLLPVAQFAAGVFVPCAYGMK